MNDKRGVFVEFHLDTPCKGGWEVELNSKRFLRVRGRVWDELKADLMLLAPPLKFPLSQHHKVVITHPIVRNN